MMPRSLPPLEWWRAVKSVTWRPASRNGAEVAQVLLAHRARRAAAAGRDEAEDDVVAGLQVDHARADLDHLAGTFVAADDRELLDAQFGGDLRWHHHVAGDEVLVGVAQARGGQLHQHLALLGRVERDVLDAPVRVRLPENCCLRLHASPFVVIAP